MTAGIPKYTSQMAIRIGAPSQVELPARVFCGRLTGFLFDTSKCFLLPGAVSGMREVRQFYDEHPGLDVLISGHADRAGAADCNLVLSAERAEAVEAFVLDQVERWLPWYGASKPAAKRWGTVEDQHMLTHLGHYAGPITGRHDAATTDAISAFRTAEGLGAGGADDAMRGKLVERYMKSPGTSLPVGTRVMHHGCGESHPVKHTADGAAAAENRRVEVFFFEGPVEPQPPATCPAGGCAAYPAWRKRVVETIDLNVRRELVEITVALRDRASALIARAPFRMNAGDCKKVGRAGDGQATLQVPVTAERCLVEWGREADPDIADDGKATAFRVELYLHYDLGSDEEQAKMRLHNLGYLDANPLDQMLRAFQQDSDLPETGTLDGKTRQKLIDVHGKLATPVAALEGEHG
jgi:outer membrane protein OmpA-like peptidoglycan-associated protein